MDHEVSEQTQAIQTWVRKLNEGVPEAREELLRLANDRLQHLTRHMKRDFSRVGRWEETEDIFQEAALRLYRALETVELTDATHFLRLAAQQIRRQLIDLSRSYYGPQGAARHHASQAGHADEDDARPQVFAFEAGEISQDPQRMEEWSDFHQLIEDLDVEERVVVDLLWYHGMTQEDAAALLNVSVKTIKRRWRSAKLTLHEHLNGELPGDD